MNKAFKPDAPPQLQKAVLKGMGSLVLKIRGNVESMRMELLNPINNQEREVLDSINRSYQEIHYANSIVTGHLSSIVKVHETQAELLESIGVKRDLRTTIGKSLSTASEKISGLIDTSGSMESKLSRAEEKAKQIKGVVSELRDKLSKKLGGDE